VDAAALNAFKERDLLTMNLDNEPALSAEPLPCRHLTAEGTNHQKRLLDPLPRDGPCTLLVSSAGTLLLAIPGIGRWLDQSQVRPDGLS
jgi:hypothetical protein